MTPAIGCCHQLCQALTREEGISQDSEEHVSAWFFFFSFFPVVSTEVLSGKRGWVLPAWEVTHHHPDWYSERVGTGKASRPLCCERNKAGRSRLGRV